MHEPSDAERVMQSYMCVNRMHKQLIDSRVEGLMLHRSQHMMLLFLGRLSHDPTQREVADKLEISQAAVAVTLKKLERQGYITRCSEPDDIRCNHIHLTARGQEVLKESNRIFLGIEEEMFRGFSAEELAAFAASLEKMKQNLHAAGAAGDLHEPKMPAEPEKFEETEKGVDKTV